MNTVNITPKHTPGPWACVLSCLPGSTYTIGSRLGAVATVPDKHPSASRESESNARLIASAPELLEALERLVALDSSAGKVVLITTYMESVSSAIKDARNAIAKATGGAK